MTTAHDVRLFEKEGRTKDGKREKNTKSVRVSEAFDVTRSRKYFNHGSVTQQKKKHFPRSEQQLKQKQTTNIQTRIQVYKIKKTLAITYEEIWR